VNAAPAAAPDATILLVDDNAANLQVLRESLAGLGGRILVAKSGPAALAIVERAVPDLVLLDIMMPEMDGFEVCRRLKQDERFASIPVLFLSALSDTADKVRAFAAGGVDYVTKPFQVEEVRARVATHLGLRRLQGQLEAANRELTAGYERLRELEALRDDLVNMVVHDLRNPLTAIALFATLLEESEGERLTEKGRGNLGRIAKSADVLIEMISSMLDVSKMESGQMTIARAPCDLAAIAREVVARLEGLALGRELTIEGPAQPAPLEGDEQLLSRLLQNLVGNALKFAPPDGGWVRVGLEPGERSVRCTVRDNGPGIPREHQQRVFDKFWQAEARQRGHKYSSGLGLTFCKMVVEAHGGSIGVESEVGAGSCFWFELPRRAPDAPG
jgi:signal transduction histidine kinase